jgi:hypothetical protein
VLEAVIIRITANVKYKIIISATFYISHGNKTNAKNSIKKLTPTGKFILLHINTNVVDTSVVQIGDGRSSLEVYDCLEGITRIDNDAATNCRYERKRIAKPSDY